MNYPAADAKTWIACLTSGLLLALAGATASAAAPPGPGKCPPYADGRTYDASPIVDAIDTNRDGKMTHKEWRIAGAPEPSWRSFMSKPKVKAQGYITREDFLADTPPPGIDANCDGKISMEEFLATKKWKMRPPPARSDSKSGPEQPHR